MIVLGIDPGMADTGYGVVAVDGSRLRPLGHGVLTTPAGDPPEAIRLTAGALRDLERLLTARARARTTPATPRPAPPLHRRSA